MYYIFPVYGGIHWFKGPVANISTLGEESEESIIEKDQVEVKS